MKKGFLITILFLLCGCSIGYNKYEYYDKNGEMGYAEECYISHGTAYCITKDNWKIEVSQFRGINE